MPIMDIITREQLKFAKVVIDENTAQIAEIAGIGKATLERFEAGKSKPKLETLIKIKEVVDSLVKSKGWHLEPEGGISPMPAPEDANTPREGK